VMLTWNAVADDDFAYYKLYRSPDENFEPAEEFLIGEVDLSEFVDPLTDVGDYFYRISGVDIHGNEGEASPEINITVVDIDQVALPTEYTLDQNYPNPFNPTTTIKYGIPEASEVVLHIYDIRGNLIVSLESGTKQAGWYSQVWNGVDDAGHPVSTGLYLARLQAGSYSRTIKMLFLK